MIVVQEKDSLQANGARTSDWIEQVKGGVLYAYDLGTLVSESKGATPASEAWLFRNPKALAAVRRGLNDAAEGRVSKVNLKNL